MYFGSTSDFSSHHLQQKHIVYVEHANFCQYHQKCCLAKELGNFSLPMIKIWHTINKIQSPIGHEEIGAAWLNNRVYVHSRHDDVMKWKHFPCYWPFVWGIHRSPTNFLHKSQRRGALMFSLICAWINNWVNNGEAGDLRCHHAHYDTTVMRLTRN